MTTNRGTRYYRRMQKLREQGEADFRAGKDIMAFDGRGERERAAYEFGWRAAKDEALAKSVK